MRFLRDPRLVTLLRVALGVLFVVAALPKLADPAGFAKSIANYRMLPVEVERVVALALPAVELLLGVLLIVGLADAGASLLALLLLIVFTVAIGVAIARGLDISCGCFHTEAGAKVGAGKLLENVAFILAAWWVWTQDRSWLSVRGWLGKSGDIE